MEMRTQDEIVARYEERKESDLFGFEAYLYLYVLDLEHARPYLDEGAEETFVEPVYTREAILETMKDYMSFANEKADNERGLSARRSIMHFIAWIWLIGDDAFLKKVEHEAHENFHNYGKPILAMIEAEYGWS